MIKGTLNFSFSKDNSRFYTHDDGGFLFFDKEMFSHRDGNMFFNYVQTGSGQIKLNSVTKEDREMYTKAIPFYRVNGSDEWASMEADFLRKNRKPVSGIYLIYFKSKSESPDYVYIGESSNILNRVEQHVHRFCMSYDGFKSIEGGVIETETHTMHIVPLFEVIDRKDVRVAIEEGILIKYFNSVIENVPLLNKRGNPEWKHKNNYFADTEVRHLQNGKPYTSVFDSLPNTETSLPVVAKEAQPIPAMDFYEQIEPYLNECIKPELQSNDRIMFRFSYLFGNGRLCINEQQVCNLISYKDYLKVANVDLSPKKTKIILTAWLSNIGYQLDDLAQKKFSGRRYRYWQIIKGKTIHRVECPSIGDYLDDAINDSFYSVLCMVKEKRKEFAIVKVEYEDIDSIIEGKIFEDNIEVIASTTEDFAFIERWMGGKVIWRDSYNEKSPAITKYNDMIHKEINDLKTHLIIQ